MFSFGRAGTGRKTRLLSEGCGIIRTRQCIAAKYNRITAGAHIHCSVTFNTRC